MAVLPAPPTDEVRSWIAGRVRSIVIGEGDRMSARRAEIWDSDEVGWFADDEPIRRVHADSAMLIGALRALLLQSLHPRAMAGVAQHSDYRHDPWGRIQRTADFLAATTFGPAVEAERAVERVRRVHERVVGTTADGRPYAANDPHLLRWVHVAEVDSFLAAHDRYGAEPLVGAERDRYVENAAVVADALGAADAPRSARELRSQLHAYRRELRSTPEARDGARYLLITPPIGLIGRAPYGVLAAAAVSLLPTWARWPLRLPWLPVSERLVVRPAGDALTRTLRWALTADPP